MLQQAKANLSQAQANLTKSRSDLERTKVALTDAQQKYTRAKELAAKQLLPQSFEATKEMHVVLDLHAITVEDDHAFADVRYASRARIELPSGSSWDAHREFNRIEFVREDGNWMIVSGL